MTSPANHSGGNTPRDPSSASPQPAAKTGWPLWSILAFALLILLVSLIWGYRSFLWEKLCDYYGFCTNKENVRALLVAAGALAPLVFIVIQTLQVVFAPIPGEATGFLGGFLFGAPLGMLYSTIGLTIGSILAFLLGRWLEKKFVERWVSKEALDKFDFLMEHQGALIAFFLFLFPGFPKDYLCFILGLSPMSFKLFLVLVTVGRLPGTLMLSLQGAKVYEGEWLVTAVLLALCLLLGVIMYYYRETLYRWIRRWEHKNNLKNNLKKG
jgi:uncharacterized membrane protein YdjX (TVP38/TMEM64 family)